MNTQNETVATGSRSPLPPPAEFTPAEVRPFGTLILTDSEGCVRGLVCGLQAPGGALSKHLGHASAAGHPAVRKTTNDSLTPLGQDTYEVDREFLLGMMSMLWDWDNVAALFKVLPQSCRFTFAVSC